MYGFGDFQPSGYCSFAASSETEPAMMTSSPFCQLTGVATLCLAVSCSESITRSTSSKLRPGRHRVDEDQLDLLVGADHEDVAHRLVVGRGARRRVARDVVREHPVELRDVEVGVADERVVGRGALRLLDVLRPLLVVLDGIDGEADDLDAAAGELRLDAGHVAELGRAHGREVARVREQHGPRVAEPVVELDVAFRGLGLEIGRRCHRAAEPWCPSCDLRLNPRRMNDRGCRGIPRWASRPSPRS